MPKYVAPDTRWRDRLVALSIGLGLLALVGLGLMSMSKPHVSANILVGVVVGKQFTPQKEEQVSFSGRRLQSTRQIDGEYVLKVRVEKENREYEVPVEKPTYELKAEGDKMEFVRPSSEQR